MVGQVVGGLILILETASHDFGQVLSLVDNLVLQVILGLPNVLLDRWLVADSMLVHDGAERVVSVLHERLEGILLALVQAVLHFLLGQRVGA